MFGQIEEVWIFVQKKILRNQMAKWKTQEYFRQSLNIALAWCPAAPLGLLRLEGDEQLGLAGHGGGQSNCLQGFPHSASPQHLAIAALYAFLASVRNDSSAPVCEPFPVKSPQWRRVIVEPSGQTSPGEDSRIPSCSSVRQRGHLDVEGGREGSQDGEREERKRRQTRKSPLEGYLRELLLGGANSALFQLLHSPDVTTQDLRPQFSSSK